MFSSWIIAPPGEPLHSTMKLKSQCWYCCCWYCWCCWCCFVGIVVVGIFVGGVGIVVGVVVDCLPLFSEFFKIWMKMKWTCFVVLFVYLLLTNNSLTPF